MSELNLTSPDDASIMVSTLAVQDACRSRCERGNAYSSKTQPKKQTGRPASERPVWTSDHSDQASMEYPAPRTVRMTSCMLEKFSALRRRPTWTSTVRSST